MKETKLVTPNPFANRNSSEVWAELLSRPAKIADKQKILKDLAVKIQSKKQKSA